MLPIITSCCPHCLQSPALWTQYPLGCSSASQLLSVQYYVMHLCNLSFQRGIFPSQLTHALVTPHLKKPALDPDTASSYRPISNLSFVSKLVERLVAKRFTSHVNLHALFPAQQSAYRPFHSVYRDSGTQRPQRPGPCSRRLPCLSAGTARSQCSVRYGGPPGFAVRAV